MTVHTKYVQPDKPTSFLQHINYSSTTDIMAIRLHAFLSYIVFPFLSPAEPSENFREILQNVAKPHGVSNMRKLGHLNNFIKVKLSSYVFFCYTGQCWRHWELVDWFSTKTNMETQMKLWIQTCSFWRKLTPCSHICKDWRAVPLLCTVVTNLSSSLYTWLLLPAGLAVPVHETVNVTGALGMRKQSGPMCTQSNTLTLKPGIPWELHVRMNLRSFRS